MAMAIAKGSPHFQQAIARLQDADLRFEVESKDVRLAATNGSSVGLVVRHNISPSPRYGADLILTVDLTANLLTATQFVIGWCLINSLDVASTMFDARNPLEVQLSPTRNEELSLTLVKPRVEQQWSFFRPGSPPQRPEELVEVGWPPEAPEYPRWNYVGCIAAEWIDNQGVLMYRSNIRKGLSWWNSWLYWLCYRASVANGGCNLQSGFTFYPCIHEATHSPYATYAVTSGSGRNQWYVDTDAWDTYVHYNVPHIDMGLPNDGGYHGTVSAWDSTPWGTLECPAPPPPVTAYWRRTPFGACYATWAEVGSDTITGNLNTGWVTNTQAGLIGRATVQLQAGYNTIYFPAIKDLGAFPTNNQVSIGWERPDGSLVPYTYTFMNLYDIQDSGDYNYNGYTQRTLSAMVWPAVCKASAPRTVTIRLSRNYSGPLIYVGRPVVMPGMCSWFATQ